MQRTKELKAFSLIEISIVIVIVALIIAGVTAGRNLMREAGLRNVVTDIRKLEASVNAFKLQYGKYPGDLNNAFSFWNTNCAATANDCNGDGGGTIRGAGAGTAAYQEEYMAFRHLSLSGLIPGNYSGTKSSPNPISGTDLPSGPFSKSGYSLAWSSSLAYGNYWGPVSIGNFIWFGSSNGDIMRASVLKVSEQYSIDIKIDDGLPHLGKMHSSSTSTGCTVGSTAPTTYNISATAKVCAIKYKF